MAASRAQKERARADKDEAGGTKGKGKRRSKRLKKSKRPLDSKRPYSYWYLILDIGGLGLYNADR